MGPPGNKTVGSLQLYPRCQSHGLWLAAGNMVEGMPLSSLHHKTFSWQTDTISWMTATSAHLGRSVSSSVTCVIGWVMAPAIAAAPTEPLPGHLARPSVFNGTK